VAKLKDSKGEIWPVNGASKNWDYGISVKTQNPMNPSKKLFLFAGCHHSGTIGAAISAITRSVIPIIKKHNDGESFECFLRVGKNDEGQSTKIEIIEPDYISKEIGPNGFYLHLDELQVIQTSMQKKTLNLSYQ